MRNVAVLLLHPWSVVPGELWVSAKKVCWSLLDVGVNVHDLLALLVLFTVNQWEGNPLLGAPVMFS